MYNNPDIVVIVLDYNRPDLTNRCLESIWKYNRVNIILVNSGLSDFLEYDNKVPFKYIVNRRGRSFSIGMNTGIKAASSLEPKYIILLNNDAVVTEGAFRLLVTTLNSYPKIAMVSSGYRYSGGYLNKGRQFNVKYGPDEKPRVRIRKRLTGFCLCARYEIISDMGGYDENFIFTMEDDDLSLRIVEKGFILAEVENSVVIHEVSTSIRFSDDRDIFFLAKSFGLGCGLLINKKERNSLIMLAHLFVQTILFFVKTIVIGHRIKIGIIKFSLLGFKDGLSKQLKLNT